jgi:hypothetical protein
VRARVGLGMSFASRNALDHVWRVKTQFYFVSLIRLLSEKSQGKLPTRLTKYTKDDCEKMGKDLTPPKNEKNTSPGYAKKSPFSKTEGPRHFLEVLKIPL